MEESKGSGGDSIGDAAPERGGGASGSGAGDRSGVRVVHSPDDLSFSELTTVDVKTIRQLHGTMKETIHTNGLYVARVACPSMCAVACARA
jgi:hypothetical protein